MVRRPRTGHDRRGDLRSRADGDDEPWVLWTNYIVPHFPLEVDELDEEYADVANVTSYFVTIEEDFDANKDVWAEFFGEPYPCHTAIDVAGLVEPEILGELEFELPME